LSDKGSDRVERDARAHSVVQRYDTDARHLGRPHDCDDPHRREFFGRVADAIVTQLDPRTVLDAGCGSGLLVQALRDRGVEAYGFDISDYAISQVPEELRPFCRVASVSEELERDYDLIVCIEVLEHVPPELVEDAVRNVTEHTPEILFSSTPHDFADPTHRAVKPLESWIGLFAEHGFFRNVDLDPSFVAPHAVHLVRSTGTAVAVARNYERWHWNRREELAELREEARRAADIEVREAREEARTAARLRELTLEAARLRDEASWWRDEAELAMAELAEWRAFRGRSGYRIFLRLANLRLRLAPRGTRRDRTIRRVLRALAETVDRTTERTSKTRTGVAAVLFISACPGDAKRYRRDHQAEELALGGATVVLADDTDVDFDDALARYECFILHRVPWSRELARFVRQARDHGKPVLFDTDDLVFEPEAHAHIAALLELDEAHRARYIAGLRRMQRTLQECDGVLVSTEPLRAAASRYNPSIEIAYNAASDEMTLQADVAIAARRGRADEDETVTIAYFSGTATHNVDFAEAADAVLWALETYPNVRFLAVGLLALDARFDAYADRVQRMPLQPWQELPAILVRTDINLAPLEPRNPFTDCKSCIKYVEAALVGTPTIASPRSDFVRAIEPGRNGLLADTPAEWRNAIGMLVESPERRNAIAREAFADARANHTVRARSTHLLRSVATLVKPRADAILSVNWVLRAPVATSAADRAILRLADGLGERGHHVRIYVEPVEHLAGLGSTEIASFVQTSFDLRYVDVHVGHTEIAKADATIATSRSTASTVANHDDSLFKLHFVAELEPSLAHILGPVTAEADREYLLPLRHVVFGEHLAAPLRARTDEDSDVVDLALDDVFRVTVPPRGRPGPRKVLFQAQAETPRDSELGLRALERVKTEAPDVEVILFGATDAELGEIPFTARTLGSIDQDGRAAILNEAHALLDVSSNDSVLSLEARACGCAVVDLHDFVGTATPEELANAVLRLTRDDDKRVRLAERGIATAADMTWERSGAQLEKILRETCFVRLSASAP